MKNLKKYTVTLKEDETEALRKAIRKQGFTLSAWIRAVIAEQQNTMKLFKISPDVKNMTIGEFTSLAERMVKHLGKEK